MPTILRQKNVHLTDEQSKIVNDFFAMFPTELHCIEEICKELAPKICTLCGSDQLIRAFGSRISYCKTCRGKIYCTGDSFFHRIRKLQAMMACIYFFEMGFCIPSTKLAEIFGVAIATAQRIIKKVSHVLKEQTKVELPQIASAEFISIFGKRSTETPARKPPRFEQKILEEEYQEKHTAQETQENCYSHDQPEAQEDSKASFNPFSSFLGESDSSILNHINDEPISFDELLALNLKSSGELASILGILEIEGLIKRLPGDRFIKFKPQKDDVFFLQLSEEPDSNLDKTILVMKYIRENFGACSRKYLDHFLAKHWCFRDRARWSQGQVLRACLDYGYISLKSIRANVTPLITHFCPF